MSAEPSGYARARIRLTAMDANWRRERNARKRGRHQLASSATAVRATLPVRKEEELDLHFTDNLQENRQHYSVVKVFIINSSSKIAINKMLNYYSWTAFWPVVANKCHARERARESNTSTSTNREYI